MAAALDIITDALQETGAIGAGETPNGADSALGLSRLNQMLGAWSLQPLTIPVVSREVFDIVANDGSYTIGDGADFDTSRPAYLTGASLLLNSADPVVEIPLTLLTDDGYRSIPMKTQTNSLFTAIYYTPTFTTSGWGTIKLWPVPDTADNDLVLYFPQQLVEFADLATDYELPPGCQEAILYNLAVRLCKPFGRPLDPELTRMARSSLATYKRMNTKMSDLSNDAAALSSRRWGYNINTDQGG